MELFFIYLSILMVITGTLYAIPQCIRSIKRGNSKGLSVWFLGLWLSDKLISLIYVSHLENLPLIIKYSISLIAVLIILYYKKVD